MIKKHFLVFAAIAAIFTVSCASTPASEQKEEAVQNLEEKSGDSESVLKTDDNKNSNTKNDSIENIEEKFSDDNPLETINETAIEQNRPENISESIQEKTETEENQIPNQIPENEISEEPKIETDKSEKNPQKDFQENEEIVKSGEKELEKVAEEDLPFEKQSENAPLEAESNIFAEPNVIDISEEPEVFEENQANSQNENQNPQNEESDETKTTEEDSENPAENETSNENKNSDETNGIIEETSEPTQDSNETGNENNGAETSIKEDSEAENQKPGENEDLPLPEKQQNEEKTGQDSDSEKIAPSRKVTIKRNQNLYVVYPGNGWIYIGEEKTPALLTYFGRMTDSSRTTFTLHSLDAGETFLHFYKNDALTGKSIDDYLLVTVEDKIANPDEKTLAPSYAEIVPPQFQKRQNGISIENEKADIKNGVTENTSDSDKNQNLNDNKTSSLESENLKNGNSSEKSYIQNPREPRENSENQNFSSNDVKTLISTPEKQNQQKNAASSGSGNLYQNQKNDSQKSNPKDENSSLSNENDTQQNFVLEPEVQMADGETESGEELLEKAKSLFDEKKYAESLESCLDFINGSNENLDEAYYLLGQIYEAESPVKNIRNALDAYTAVTKNFPLSKLWQKANQRSVYLKRFYIDIR